MLEALVGGLVGAVVGAFAGGYATYRAERRLDRKRQDEEAMEWMLSELDSLRSVMWSMYEMGMGKADMSRGESVIYIRRKAIEIRSRIHELDDKDTRRELYTLFERYYDDHEEMTDAINAQWTKMHEQRRPELREVVETLHGDPDISGWNQHRRARKNGKWMMPPKHAWRARINEVLKKHAETLDELS